MSRKNELIRTNQRKALEVLVAGGTVAQAAAASGVNERTVYNWRTEENFKQALQEAGDKLIGETVQALSGASLKAVATLIQVMEADKTAEGVKVQAAKAILDSALKLRELHGLEMRVRELEERAGR